MIEFGTGGWRAIIGDEFIKSNIQLLAQGMANKMKAEQSEGNELVIGYDRRFLSKEALYWVCEVMAANEIKCYFVNRSVPTPLVMYYTMVKDFQYGMMITASHNSALYNGIKIFTKGGRDADVEQTKEVESYTNKVKQVLTCSIEEAYEKGLIEDIYPMNDYLDNIKDNIDMEAIKGAQLKIVLDPMHGVSKQALSILLSSAHCDLTVIRAEHDTLFGGRMPSPSEDTLRYLQHTVKENQYHIGIATDGDGDRLGVIDDNGRYIHSNDILVMLYYYLVKYKGWKGPVVRNIATTHMLDKVAKKLGECCYEVPVGFKNISSKMTETNAILGGESSGGLTVKGHINGKDGVYAALLLIEMMAVMGKKISEIMDDLKKEIGDSYMAEADHSFSKEKKEEIYQQIFVEKNMPDLSDVTVEKISYEDGCKVYFDNNNWIICRFSGTEPLLRIFCEMENKKKAEAMIERFESHLGL